MAQKNRRRYKSISYFKPTADKTRSHLPRWFCDARPNTRKRNFFLI